MTTAKLFLAVVVVLISISPVIPAQEEGGIYGVVSMQRTGSTQLINLADAQIIALDGTGAIVARTFSDENGEYRLVLPPGHFRLKAEHKQCIGFDTREVILQVQQGFFTLFNITMSESAQQQTGELRGTVTTAENQFVEGATVTVSDSAGQQAGTYSTDVNGAFSAVLPVGSYTVTVTYPELETLGPLNVDIGSEQPVELALTMQKTPVAQGGIQGLVRARAEGSAPGKPISGAVVTAITEDGQSAVTATSNDIGFYKISLAPGSYRLSVNHPDYDDSNSGETLVSVESEKTSTWNTLMTPNAPASGIKTCRERFPVSIGSSYGEKHTIYLMVDQPGSMVVSYRWTGDAADLALIIKGPDGVIRRLDGDSPLSVTIDIGTDLIARGTQWEISIANYSGGSGQGTINVSYPCEQ